MFAGLYLGYGYVSSVTIRAATRSLDLFFLIACLFSILAVVVRQAWSAALLGTVTGLIFLGTPAPFAPHIAASLVANGFVFDLFLRMVKSDPQSYSRNTIIAAATVGNLVMAVVGLALLQVAGAIPASITIWAVALIGDSLVGAAGALLGLSIARRVRGASIARR